MKILWVSRHTMTTEQLFDLHRIYGDFELSQLDKTIKDVSEILQIYVDIYAVVLPMNILIQLKNSTNADVIQPVSGRVPTGNRVKNSANNCYENEYIFKHLYWEKVIKADIKLQKL